MLISYRFFTLFGYKKYSSIFYPFFDLHLFVSLSLSVFLSLSNSLSFPYSPCYTHVPSVTSFLSLIFISCLNFHGWTGNSISGNY